MFCGAAVNMYSSGPVMTGLKTVDLIRAAMMEAEVATAETKSTVRLKTSWSDDSCVHKTWY